MKLKFFIKRIGKNTKQTMANKTGACVIMQKNTLINVSVILTAENAIIKFSMFLYSSNTLQYIDLGNSVKCNVPY